MNTTAGDRLKALRELIGLTQSEFADFLNIEFSRYKNVESKKVRMSEGEFEAVCKNFPKLCEWITYEGDIKLSELKRSQEAFVKLAVAQIEAGRIPEGYFLEEKIKP